MIRAVVDRIEDEFAVLLVGPKEVPVSFPLSCLPSVREGMILDFAIKENGGEEARRRAEVESLLQRLTARKPDPQG